MIRVLIAHPEALLRGALAAVLDQEADIDVVAALASDNEIRAVAPERVPHIAVLDGADDDLFGRVTRLRVVLPGARPLLLLEPGRYHVFATALQQGRRDIGFVTRQATPAHLVSAVRTLASGGAVFDPELVASMLATADNPFTPRERQVLALVADGADAKGVAAQLYLSPRTVRNVLSRVKAKTGGRTDIEAIRLARGSGWL